MIRAVAILSPILFPGVAAAHPGHLAESAGHGHWIALAALAGAAAVAAAMALSAKSRKERDAEPDDAEAHPDESA